MCGGWSTQPLDAFGAVDNLQVEKLVRQLKRLGRPGVMGFARICASDARRGEVDTATAPGWLADACCSG